jgi:transposase
MIVIGADTHKATHTCAAVEQGTGEALDVLTVPARASGFARLLEWARGLGSDCVWAIEDCRHVSGPLERFLIARGERVVRVAPHLGVRERRAVRERGKSDRIDALAVARAALTEGVERLPAAFLDEEALEIKLLADHRQALVAERTRRQNRLRWLLHDRWPELQIPAGALDRDRWIQTLTRRLARAEQTVQMRICRELLREIRKANREVKALERELTERVTQRSPQLLELPGCGTLSAATIIAETAGPGRFPTEAKLARTAGVAPIPASSGQRQRHRLDRGGNRRLNCALHRIAIVQGRHHPEAAAYLQRRESEGKSRREAIRALKRHLARRIWHIINTPQGENSRPTLT